VAEFIAETLVRGWIVEPPYSLEPVEVSASCVELCGIVSWFSNPVGGSVLSWNDAQQWSFNIDRSQMIAWAKAVKIAEGKMVNKTVIPKFNLLAALLELQRFTHQYAELVNKSTYWPINQLIGQSFDIGQLVIWLTNQLIYLNNIFQVLDRALALPTALPTTPFSTLHLSPLPRKTTLTLQQRGLGQITGLQYLLGGWGRRWWDKSQRRLIRAKGREKPLHSCFTSSIS